MRIETVQLSPPPAPSGYSGEIIAYLDRSHRVLQDRMQHIGIDRALSVILTVDFILCYTCFYDMLPSVSTSSHAF